MHRNEENLTENHKIFSSIFDMHSSKKGQSPWKQNTRREIPGPRTEPRASVENLWNEGSIPKTEPGIE